MEIWNILVQYECIVTWLHYIQNYGYSYVRLYPIMFLFILKQLNIEFEIFCYQSLFSSRSTEFTGQEQNAEKRPPIFNPLGYWMALIISDARTLLWNDNASIIHVELTVWMMNNMVSRQKGRYQIECLHRRQETLKSKILQCLWFCSSVILVP